MMFLVATAFAACASTTLRGFQNKVVAAGAKIPAFTGGLFMSLMDVLVMTAIVRQTDITTLLAAAVGAGTGWVLGMTLHDFATRNRRKAAEKAAKKEFKQSVDKRIDKVLKRGNAPSERNREDEVVGDNHTNVEVKLTFDDGSVYTTKVTNKTFTELVHELNYNGRVPFIRPNSQGQSTTVHFMERL